MNFFIIIMVATINKIKGSYVTSFNKCHKKGKKQKQKFKPYKGYIFAWRINIQFNKF